VTADAGTRWLLAIAATCVAALGVALVAQHGYDMRPCPWCILQRLIYVAIALACGVAAFVARPARLALTATALVLAGLGVVAAVYQHQVAAQQFSCGLTLADRIITALGIETLAPALFGVTASCADAAVSMLGVPFEYWSLALYALLAAALAWVLRHGTRSRDTLVR